MTASLRRPVFATLLWLAVSAISLQAAPVPPAADGLAAARALVSRVAPGYAAGIDVEPLPAGADPIAANDAFEVESRAGRIVLRGNSGVAIGSALNWYLRNVVHASISWDGDNLPALTALPPVPQKVRLVTPYRHRVYLNYCTFNYTASWWDRARWEREIDWMALNGITMPLAATGQEAVWQATLRRFRMSDDEIRRFFAGPAFLAWQWMTNLEGWGGPLPQSWIDSHLELGRFIVERERALGMTPILQGFTGCVPLAFIEKFPDARILRKQIWCDVPPGTAQLDPLDPLFARVGRAFLEEQARLFGNDHLFAGDPFHEGTPPVDTPAYLHDVGARLCRIVTEFDPQGVIVMQGWTIRQGIVEGIPADRLLVLDLTGQKWRETSAFWGRPWVCGVLHNFGGRAYLGGNLPQIATTAPSLLANPAAGGRLVGLGLFPEAIEHNPLLYALSTDLAWQRPPLDLPSWTRGYIVARYGRDVPAAQQAWRRLLDSVYAQTDPTPPMESPLQARPALTLKSASPWGSFVRGYDPAQVWTAWRELLDAAPTLAAVDPYRYDLVDVARQALADLAVPLQREVAATWLAGDRARYAAARDRFLALGADLDALLATRREFLLGPWLADARRWGATRAESDLYERNARLLVTTWGPNQPKSFLADYACRQWSGLLSGYYLPRWQRFFAYLEKRPAGQPYPKEGDDPAFSKALSDWENAWCDAHDPYSASPRGDSLEVARALLAKWEPAMHTAYGHFDWAEAALKP